MPDCHKLNQRLFVVVVVVVDRKTLLFYFAKLFPLKHYVAADSAQVFVEQCQKIIEPILFCFSYFFAKDLNRRRPIQVEQFAVEQNLEL